MAKRRTSTTAQRALNAVSATLSLGTGVTTFCVVYLGLITGFATRRAFRGEAPAIAPSTTRCFAVLVPAHNEEAVIERALKSFRSLDYPDDAFEVHVVADNCSDRTAQVVSASGFHIHERNEPEPPGKGPALNWLLDRLAADGRAFDSVVIVDADTTVHPAFLKEVARALDGGAKAVQGQYLVRDASQSTAAALRFAALACRHHLRPLGRTAIGGSSGLYGNGMAFDTEIIRGRQWTGHLIEDMEFQIDLLLDGQRVSYVPTARLEAEMPHNLAAAKSQNERWELGRMQLARRSLPSLARRLRIGSPHLRVAYADAMMDQLVPPLSILIAADAIALVGAAALQLLGSSRINRLTMRLAAVSSTILGLHVLAGLRSVHAPAAVYRALLSAPRLVLWKVVLLVRITIRPQDVTWQRTPRNEQPS